MVVRAMRAHAAQDALVRQCLWVLATVACCVENRRKIVAAVAEQHESHSHNLRWALPQQLFC